MTDITTAAEVYTLLGDEFWDYMPIEEGRLLLRIERSEGALGYDGIYMDDNGQAMSLAVLHEKSDKAVEQLYQLTSQGGKNPWNLLYFTLLPGRAFEVDFVLDEDAISSLAFLARTRTRSRAKREAAYDALMEEQAQAQAGRIFTTISQRLPALVAGWLPGWQRLVVRASYWNGGTFELLGFAYAGPQPGAVGEPEEEEGEPFSIVQDYQLAPRGPRVPRAARAVPSRRRRRSSTPVATRPPTRRQGRGNFLPPHVPELTAPPRHYPGPAPRPLTPLPEGYCINFDS